MGGRCRSCDKKLNEFELVRKIKSPITGKTEYLELCASCVKDGDFNDFRIINGRVTSLIELDDE
jgi:hypothetical protein